MKKIIYLLFTIIMVSGYATTKYYPQQTHVQQAPIDEHKTLILQWKQEFQIANYHKKLIMLKDYINRSAQAELIVLDGISTAWDLCIRSGKSFSYDIARQLSVTEQAGWTEIYRMHFETIKKAMADIKEPPKEYVKAYDLLLELFSIYSQLYSLARSPQGSYVSFNKTVNDLSLEFKKYLNKLDIFLL